MAQTALRGLYLPMQLHQNRKPIMRMMRTILTSLVLLVLLAPLTSQALLLVTEDDPPHNMLRDGKIVGMATDKLEEALRRAGISRQIELMPWARAYQSALTQPEYCVFSAARTKERETFFKWVGPIAAMDWVLYTRADNPAPRPARLEDVRKETIGGYLQDVISVWLADQGYRVETASSDAANPRKLLMGRFDYWASSKPRATSMLTKDALGNQIVPVLTFGHTDLYLACNRTTPDELVRVLNGALRAMKDDGTSARIDARYAQ
jgi:polar amino acid transport system substrate-binding protein